MGLDQTLPAIWVPVFSGHFDSFVSLVNLKLSKNSAANTNLPIVMPRLRQLAVFITYSSDLANTQAPSLKSIRGQRAEQNCRHPCRPALELIIHADGETARRC